MVDENSTTASTKHSTASKPSASAGNAPPNSNFRFVVLIVATLTLAMLFGNTLTVNFTIVCMTEEKFHFENFSLNLGIDVFEKVNFEPDPAPPNITVPPTPEGKVPEVSTPSFPSTSIPGIDFSAPSFNSWKSLELFTRHPDIFISLIKKFAVEAAKIAAQRLGQAVDPRNIDYARFREGLNFSDVSWDSAIRLRDYLIRRIELAQNISEQYNQEAPNIEKWRHVRSQDIEFRNITWNGVLSGRIKIVDRFADHYYSKCERVVLLVIFALGALPALFLVNAGFKQLGCRKSVALAGIISAISTALCPPMASLGYFALLFMRLLQGVGFAFCFPAIGAILLEWPTVSEGGLFVGILSGFLPAGVFLSFPLSGLLCPTAGWQFSHYTHALLTAIVVGTWWILYRDSPGEHPKVSITEMREIQAGKEGIDGHRRHNQPKTSITSVYENRGVTASWWAAVGAMFAVMFVLLVGPTMFRENTRYCLPRISFTLALAFLLQFALKVGTAVLGHENARLRALDPILRLHIHNSIAFVGAGIGLAAALVSAHSGCFLGALWALVPSFAILGIDAGGFYKTAASVERHLNGVTFFAIQGVACVMVLLGGFFLWLTEPEDAYKWLLACIVLLVCSNLQYCQLIKRQKTPVRTNTAKSIEEALQKENLVAVDKNGNNGIQEIGGSAV